MYSPSCADLYTVVVQGCIVSFLGSLTTTLQTLDVACVQVQCMYMHILVISQIPRSIPWHHIVIEVFSLTSCSNYNFSMTSCSNCSFPWHHVVIIVVSQYCITVADTEKTVQFLIFKVYSSVSSIQIYLKIVVSVILSRVIECSH